MLYSKKIKKIKNKLKDNFWQKTSITLVFFGIFLFIIYRVEVFDNVYKNNPVKQLSRVKAQSLSLKDYASCNQTNDDEHKSVENIYVAPSESLVNKYRSYITTQNLVKNSNFGQVDINSQPLFFTQNDDSINTSFSVLAESEKVFLRSTKLTNSSATKQAAWLPSPFVIKTKSYYYSLEYRSSSKASVDLVLFDQNNKPENIRIANMPPSAAWQKLEGHFVNYDGKYSSAQLVTYPSDKGYIDIKSLTLAELQEKKLASGMVSVTFDDGWESVYDKGFPLFKKYNITTTQFIISGFSAKAVDKYMGISQLKKMQQSGHEIASHSLRHCDLTQLSQVDLDYDLVNSSKILQENGFRVSGLAYPYGAYSQLISQNSRANYSYNRTSDVGYNDFFADQYKIKTQNIDSTTTEQLNSWLKYAKENKLWLVLVYHQVGESGGYNVTTVNLENHLKAIRASGLPVHTVNGALATIQ